MNAIKVTYRGFHMTPDIEIAKHYGSQIVCFEVGNFECHIGTVDKGGPFDQDHKSGLEYVLKDERHLVTFYKNLEDVYLVK